jgi:hypothetical protein
VKLPACCALLFLAIPGASAAEDPLAAAFDRLYNFDFKGAHSRIDSFLGADPGDPLGYVARGSALLFGELDRLGILETEFFLDDGRIADKKKLKPDPNVRLRFYEAVRRGQTLAEAALGRNPRDTDALFSLALFSGLLTDYGAFVEKRQISSLRHAKTSQQYAVRLLAIDPKYADAYLTKGVSEYLLGSLPFFVRWFVRFEQAEGSKEKAVVNLQRVAREGRYMGPFARILLAVIALREKQPGEARMWLEGLVREFPENPLLRRELDKLSPKIR